MRTLILSVSALVASMSLQGESGELIQLSSLAQTGFSAPAPFRSTDPAPSQSRFSVNDTSSQPFLTPNTATNEIEAIIRQQHQALNKGDLSKAYYAFSSSDFLKSVTPRTFKNFIQFNRLFILNSRLYLESPTYNGNIAVVQGRLSNSKGSLKIEYELLQENGVWKIYRINVFPSMP